MIAFRNIFFIIQMIGIIVMFSAYGFPAFMGWCFGVFSCVYIFWEFKTEYIFITNMISSLRLVKDDRPLNERVGIFKIIKKMFKSKKTK